MSAWYWYRIAQRDRIDVQHFDRTRGLRQHGSIRHRGKSDGSIRTDCHALAEIGQSYMACSHFRRVGDHIDRIDE